MSAKLGDTLYQFDTNRRVYARAGFNSGPPIYAEHFRPAEITGESRTHWMVQGWIGNGTPDFPKRHSGPVHKVHKQTMREAGAGQWFTEAQRSARIFNNDHGYAIGEIVRRIEDEALLRKIADMVGYTGHLSGGQDQK